MYLPVPVRDRRIRFLDAEEWVELTGVLVDGYVGATDKTSALAQRLIVRLTMRLTGDGRNQSRAIRTLVPDRGQLEVRRAADAAREPAAAVACICDHARGRRGEAVECRIRDAARDRKSTRLNSSP